MSSHRSYCDDQLIEAIALSTSWRGTLRALGLKATSAGAMRSVRFHADQLGVNYGHFRGQRGWNEAQLRSAVTGAKSWSEVASQLGLLGGSAVATVKGHAARLDLPTDHLVKQPVANSVDGGKPRIGNLSRAGSLLAASWFTLCGRDISWPLEPCRYDFVVDGQSGLRRVQVKTTTVRAGASWKVFLSTTRGKRITYDPDEIDDFFIVDGDLNYFLIPVATVGGLHMIHLGAYRRFRLEKPLR